MRPQAILSGKLTCAQAPPSLRHALVGALDGAVGGLHRGVERLVHIAERQRDTFNRVYGYAVVSILFFHLTVNIGMVIGLLPVIGIPLPFFSYGGSSLWAFTVMLFILLRLDASRGERMR